MKDKVGQDITPGSYIAYGHALGRCAGIRIGRVVRAETRPHSEYRKELVDRITVRGIDDDWSNQPPTVLPRLSTLQFPDRVVVLPEAVVPENYRKLLENFEPEKA